MKRAKGVGLVVVVGVFCCLLVGCPDINEILALLISDEVLDFGTTETLDTFTVAKNDVPTVLSTFTIKPSTNWILVDPVSGSSTGPADEVEVTTRILRSHLNFGANVASIKIAANGVVPKTVQILADSTVERAPSDIDWDGLSDFEEAASETQVFFPDSDGDGISDGDELTFLSDPLTADEDLNGKPDGQDRFNIGSFARPLADLLNSGETAEDELREFHITLARRVKNNGLSNATRGVDAALGQSLLTMLDYFSWLEFSDKANGRLVDPDWLMGVEKNAPCTVIFTNGLSHDYISFLISLFHVREALLPYTDLKVLGLYSGPAVNAQSELFEGTVCPTAVMPFSTMPLSRSEASINCTTALGTIDLSLASGDFIESWVYDLTDAFEWPNVTALTDQIEYEIRKGKKVVVLAHSQGNLFAASAIDALTSDAVGDYADSVAVVEVGSPAKSMPVVSRRVSNALDKIRQLAGEREGPTDSFDSGFLFPMNHSFLDGYFAQESQARAAIIQNINELCDLLENPRSNSVR